MELERLEAQQYRTVEHGFAPALIASLEPLG